eukprot:COSAG03_NODE_1507_length_3965_cov_2.061562_1_plen_157_part_10
MAAAATAGYIRDTVLQLLEDRTLPRVSRCLPRVMPSAPHAYPACLGSSLAGRARRAREKALQISQELIQPDSGQAPGKYETKMRRAGPLKEKFILRLLAPPPLPSLSPKLSYGCLSTAAAMPQTCQGSSCRSQSSQFRSDVCDRCWTTFSPQLAQKF